MPIPFRARMIIGVLLRHLQLSRLKINLRLAQIPLKPIGDWQMLWVALKVDSLLAMFLNFFLGASGILFVKSAVTAFFLRLVAVLKRTFNTEIITSWLLNTFNRDCIVSLTMKANDFELIDIHEIGWATFNSLFIIDEEECQEVVDVLKLLATNCSPKESFIFSTEFLYNQYPLYASCFSILPSSNGFMSIFH